jgi:hypothetical protein
VTGKEILASLKASPGDREIALSSEDWAQLLEEYRVASAVDAVFDHGISHMNEPVYDPSAIRFFTPWGTVTLTPRPRKNRRETKPSL